MLLELLQVGDEHGWDARNDGTAVLGNGLEGRGRVEGGRRVEHRGAKVKCSEVADDVPDAVVEGDWDAEAVRGGEVHGKTTKEGVV